MRTGKPVSSKSIAVRRGTGAAAASASAAGSSGLAFDFGEQGGGASGGGSYSTTSGILSSVGRLGLVVLGGALVLAAALLRQDTNTAVAAAEGAAVRGAVDATNGSSAAESDGKTAASATTTSTSTTTTSTDDYITLQTPHGNIRIVLRPDLSPESVHYVRALAKSQTCTAQSCRLYRAEKPGILQGILQSGADADPSAAVQPNQVWGRCPEEYREVQQDCPGHDPHCGCHGPIMVQGDVGWAGGSAGGPDFFINTYEQPAKHWQNQHTVWGHVEDEASLATIATYWELPVKNNGGMHLLMEEVPFQVVASGKSSRMLASIRSMLHS